MASRSEAYTGMRYLGSDWYQLIAITRVWWWVKNGAMAEKQESELSMVFEDPPKLARQDNAGVWYHSTWEWTADINKNDAHVPGSGSPGKFYVYVDRVMLHEFGHTLGLPDFYS